MKFLKLNIILTICISNNLFSQAEVKFDTLQFDLGQIIEGGSNLKKNIYFTNIGNEPLIITQASTGDGGSMATWDREPILPGKKGKITFIYDTKRIGFFSKSININSNAKNGYMNYLHVKGEVVHKRTSVETKNKIIDFGEIKYDSIKSFQFYVYNSGSENLYFNFDSYGYREIDLLTIELIKSSDSLKKYHYNTFNLPYDSILIKGEIINKYGNTGDFLHTLNFIYNSHDTLKINLEGKFIGQANRDKIIEGNSTGKQVYHYFDEKLIQKELFSHSNKPQKILYFKNSNCCRLIQYSWENNSIEKEYIY